MATPQEKARCVSWFIETKSDMQTQRKYRSKYGRDPPSCPSICAWHRKFMETGTVLDKGRSGRPRTSEENIDHVRQVFQLSPTKSIRTAARQLQLTRSTVQKSFTRTCDCTLTKCNSYRHSSQMINQDKKSLQLTCWNEFLKMKRSSPEFFLVMRQPFIFQGNWTHIMWESGDQNTPMWRGNFTEVVQRYIF